VDGDRAAGDCRGRGVVGRLPAQPDGGRDSRGSAATPATRKRDGPVRRLRHLAARRRAEAAGVVQDCRRTGLPNVRSRHGFRLPEGSGYSRGFFQQRRRIFRRKGPLRLAEAARLCGRAGRGMRRPLMSHAGQHAGATDFLPAAATKPNGAGREHRCLRRYASRGIVNQWCAAA
jgi:hypothetical protein